MILNSIDMVIFLVVQRKLVKVLQQITADIHAIMDLIRKKTFKLKTNRKKFLE